MTNKKKFAFLTLALSASLILGACTPSANRSVSSDAVSSIPASPSSAESVKPSSNAASSSEALPSYQSSNADIPSSSSQGNQSSEAPVQSSDIPAQSSDTGVSSQVNPSSDSAAQSSDAGASSSSAQDSSGDSSSSSEVKSTYTVKFVVDGEVVKTYEVESGDIVEYDGQTPTKDPDANAYKYRFRNWDKDVTQPITEDTTFTAVFAEYAEEIIVDDFESYSGAGALKDAGWAAWTLGSNSWTTETQASVSISRNAADGNKALRLDAWQNNCDFMPFE